MARRKRYREIVEADLEIMPLMNLFVVLIPMLLLSAVFIEIAVIDMDMPTDSEAEVEPEEGLDLAIRIEDEIYIVERRNEAPLEIARHVEDLGSADLALVLEEIAQSNPENKAVRIVSQLETRYEEIIQVMDMSRDAGMPQVSLQGSD